MNSHSARCMVQQWKSFSFAMPFFFFDVKFRDAFLVRAVRFSFCRLR